MKWLQGVALYREPPQEKCIESHPGLMYCDSLATITIHTSGQGFGQHKIEQLPPQSHQRKVGNPSNATSEPVWLSMYRQCVGHYQTLCPSGLPALMDFSEGICAGH